MFETTMTMVGRLASAVQTHRFPDGTVKASFRVVSNERRFDRKAHEWRQGSSLFLTVTCWRDLAEHAAEVLVIGDPVVVQGRMHTREYEKDGLRHTSVELEAAALGPDLRWCTAAVVRRGRAAGPADPAPTPAQAQPVPAEPDVRSGPLVPEVEVAVGV